MGLRPVLSTRPLLVRLFREWLAAGCARDQRCSGDISMDTRPHTAMLSLPHLLGTTRHTVPTNLPCLPSPQSRLQRHF